MICKSCGEEKSQDMFYKHPKTKSGYDSSCKECRKMKAKKHREENAGYYREYEKGRARAEHRVRARSDYAKSERGKAAGRRAKKAYIERNTVKRAVHIITGNAIRDGRLVRQPCEVCGCEKVHAHHDDYSHPLNVRWLCPSHHKQWHDENGEGLNAS